MLEARSAHPPTEKPQITQMDADRATSPPAEKTASESLPEYRAPACGSDLRQTSATAENIPSRARHGPLRVVPVRRIVSGRLLDKDHHRLAARRPGPRNDVAVAPPQYMNCDDICVHLRDLRLIGGWAGLSLITVADCLRCSLHLIAAADDCRCFLSLYLFLSLNPPTRE
jgi:hypothetical protein